MKKKALLLLVVALVVGVVIYLLIPAGKDAAEDLARAGAGKAREVETVEAGAGDATFALTAGNTEISFSCSKTLAGKTVAVHGGWSGDFESKISGEAIVDPDSGNVRQVEVEIDMGSLWSEHDILTDALLHKGFFQVDEHPAARFTSTSIAPADGETSSLEGATHVVEGNFLLNGIEKSISFPAIIEAGKTALHVESAFAINRKDFNVNFTDSVGFGLLSDEDISHQVALKLKVDVSRTAPGDEAEDAGTEEASAQEAVAVDVSSLPATYVETVPATEIDFDMVLVAGDPDQGVAPFFIGRHEVTWDEFLPWSVCEDLEDSDEHGALRARKLRPSLPYGDVTRAFGTEGFPALSMSRLSAELYCDWLSKQTGRRYRLPTEAEWELAYTLGGGDTTQPLSETDADSTAIYVGNSEDDFTMEGATRSVGSMEPNDLGIHDMAGNVCEWVMTDADERVARGGHFESEASELGVGRHVEDASWNLNYPNEPKSIWWFVDAHWVGFRVVAEP